MLCWIRKTFWAGMLIWGKIYCLQYMHVLVSLICCRGSINSDDNQAVVQCLVKEVRGLNPTFNASDIRGQYYSCNDGDKVH